MNLIGDFVGYKSVPTFENFYLVTPRKGDGGGQPQVLGDEFSRWMLLERVRFTLDGLECNKIGVGYEAYRNQPSFCSNPFWSCLYNQLWNFWESDNNRINRKQQPQYVVQGRFERINQHPVISTPVLFRILLLCWRWTKLLTHASYSMQEFTPFLLESQKVLIPIC